jgi:hypothetical protein
MGIVAYRVGADKGQVQLVLVVSGNAAEHVPRLASVADIAKVANDVTDALAPIRALSERLLEVFRAAQPSELTVEFGVELGGKAGIPFITQGSAKANFQVQLKWKPDRADGGS